MDKEQLQVQSKEFLQQLKALFNAKFFQRFVILFKKPRFWIFFILNFLFIPLPGGAGFGVLLAYTILYLLLLTIALSGFPEWLIKKIEDVRRIATQTEHERLDELFQIVLKDCGMQNKKIKLYIVDTIQINALAIGSHTVAITRGAMKTFNDEQLKGILAHELAHIKNGDGQIQIIIQTLNLFYMWQLYFYSFILNFVLRNTGDNFFSNILRFLKFIVDTAINIVMFVSTAIISSNSRKQEYKADKYAANMGYCLQLKEALYKLYNIQASDKKKIIQQAQATHPKLAYRIEKLELYEQISYNS